MTGAPQTPQSLGATNDTCLRTAAKQNLLLMPSRHLGLGGQRSEKGDPTCNSQPTIQANSSIWNPSSLPHGHYCPGRQKIFTSQPVKLLPVIGQQHCSEAQVTDERITSWGHAGPECTSGSLVFHCTNLLSGPMAGLGRCRGQIQGCPFFLSCQTQVLSVLAAPSTDFASPCAQP